MDNIAELEVIKVHQTDKDFASMHKSLVKTLSRYIGRENAKKLISYTLIDALESVIIPAPYDKRKSTGQSSVFKVFEGFFAKLNDEEYKCALKDYYDNIGEYLKFMEIFSIEDLLSHGVAGDFWSEYINSIDNDSEKVVKFLDDIIPVIYWTRSYAIVYAKQYEIGNACDWGIYTDAYRRYQYWELKEHEKYFDKYPENQRESDYKYKNSEELLYEFVQNGMPLFAAISVMNVIRKGRRLKDGDREILIEYEIKNIDELESIRYLPSISATFEIIFNVNKLV